MGLKRCTDSVDSRSKKMLRAADIVQEASAQPATEPEPTEREKRAAAAARARLYGEGADHQVLVEGRAERAEEILANSTR